MSKSFPVSEASKSGPAKVTLKHTPGLSFGRDCCANGFARAEKKCGPHRDDKNGFGPTVA